MGDKNLIQVSTLTYPEIISIQDAISLLNIAIQKMQEDGYNILSTDFVGNNTFKIEFRASN